MHFTTALALASSAALVAAAPAIQVGEDDVILYGKGYFSMIKRSQFEELQALRESGVVPPAPGYLDPTLTTVMGEELKNVSSSNLSKRAATIIIPNPPSDFLGWDTQMSAVVKGAPTTITVTSGYSLANGITVGAGVDWTLIKDYLTISASTDYTRTWTSTSTQAFMAQVPANKYGAFVSNAYTHRESGNVWMGTIGSSGTLTPYQADSFKNKDYDGLSWVDGVISLCTGDTFPLKRCLGGGTI